MIPNHKSRWPSAGNHQISRDVPSVPHFPGWMLLRISQVCVRNSKRHACPCQAGGYPFISRPSSATNTKACLLNSNPLMRYVFVAYFFIVKRCDSE